MKPPGPITEAFLEPWIFLAGLTALLPLALIYMIGKKPEKEVMPSMMFFMEEQKQGAASKAMRRIRRNMFLLLHVITIIGIAAAAGSPYIQTEDRQQEAVILIDTSASMEGSIKEAKQFAKNNVGKTNTLIQFGEKTEVIGQKLGPEQAKKRIETVQVQDTKTNIVNALETARNHEGNIVIASDMDGTQTADVQSQTETITSSGRIIISPQINSTNSHGITNIRLEQSEAILNISNFEPAKRNITLSYGDQSTTKQISAFSTEQYKIPASGKTTAKLPEDKMKSDNTAYISMPETDKIKFLHLSNQENPFLKKSIGLVEFAEYQRAEPPLQQIPEADVFFVDSSRTISENVKEIERKARESGKTVIVRPKNQFRSSKYSSINSDRKEFIEKDVSITEPVKAYIRSASVMNTSFSGQSLSSPPQALKKRELGSGMLVVFNMESENYREDITYPLLWKRILQDSTDTLDKEEINLNTGDRNPETGNYMDETGFYKPEPTYSANLESFDESFDEESAPAEQEIKTTKSPQNLQSVGAAAIGLLLLLDLFLLRRTGEL
jgi:hypothetical protein